jgi:imidazole glycerol phosphate synthase subunit HisF
MMFKVRVVPGLSVGDGRVDKDVNFGNILAAAAALAISTAVVQHAGAP